ncbi:hypothetical protein Micbo1qcDRAFT_127508 [Microdochium bolleyi]|uniref:Acetyl-CoA synthetase-like protein n=1 Tax=Microdochium bolleyi TaxID=196109 RepID=A0A136ILC2_9PEZI|nr:hypothetical protein Micbo1qcDRAFT_127508 [Microdochium bolleyi]
MSRHSTLSLIHGPKEPSLWRKSFGDLIREQAARYRHRPALVIPWQSTRSTYGDLEHSSACVSKALLASGVVHGDHIGIMAGNRFEYIDVVLGAGRIGCPVVVLNNTYTPDELLSAVTRSACKVVFMAAAVGPANLLNHINILRSKAASVTIITLDHPKSLSAEGKRTIDYKEFLKPSGTSYRALEQAEKRVKPEDVINLQFTSGTTGAPKAAMLTNINVINNARMVGAALELTEKDVVCCPPPLFHCFGLVMGFLSSFSHGASLLLPSDSFNAEAVLRAAHAESATVLLGVPTMFLAEMELVAKTGIKPASLRVGLASGSSVSKALVEDLQTKLGLPDILIAYGMTETSPVSFITRTEDSLEKKLKSVGRPLPHVSAKIIDADGNVVPRGVKGEICTSGFGLQRGYWQNPEKTAEAMKTDADGVTWMHTGDEAYVDEEGFAYITGRIKDMIIRGGENIFPGEIEERLVEHTAIVEASVVGIKDEKYGEVVGSFVRLDPQCQANERPSDNELRAWVLQKLARQKAPKYVFWVGGDDRCHITEFAKTGSGKYQKHLLRDAGDRIVRQAQTRPRL